MPVAVGLEVGSSVLRAAVVERRGPSLKLRAWQEVPCDTSSSEALTQSLTHLRRTLRLKEGVVLGMPTSSVLLATVEPLIVDARRASLAVQFELQQYLPFDLEQAAWHYQWLNGPSSGQRKSRSGSLKRHTEGSPREAPRKGRGASGRGEASPEDQPGRKAIVAAMKRSRLEERVACCRRAGLSVHAVAINPLAALNTWHQDLGSATPARALFLHLSEQHAEWIAWSLSHVQVFPIVTGSTPESPDGLIQKVLHSLEALRGSMGEFLSPGTGVWLFGANTQLPHLEERLTSFLQLQVRRCDLGPSVRMEAVRIEPVERSCIAVGLALQGLGVAPLRVNLLREAQVLAHSQRIRRAAFVAGWVCATVALGCGISGMMDVRQRHTHVLALLNQRERTHQTLRPEVRTLLKQQARMERRTAQLRSLVADRSLLGELLAQLAEAMPNDVWLTKLDTSKDEWIEGILEGRAKSFQSVTQFIYRLKSVAGMTAVKPLATNVMTDEASGKELVAFSIMIERSTSPDESR